MDSRIDLSVVESCWISDGEQHGGQRILGEDSRRALG